MRDDSGVLRTIQRIRIRDAGNVLRTVWQTITAAATPSSVSGSYNGASGLPQNIATGLATVAVTGGTAPFTYAWAQSGVTPYTWTISAATAATTGFTATNVTAGVSTDADFVCTVTDATGATSTTQILTAIASNNSTA